MFKKLLLFACVALMIALVSCEGKQGEVGPKGDTGAAGPAGPAGPAGKDGKDGEDGTGGGGALILSSGATKTDEEGNFATGITDLTADEDSVLSSSAILVYIKSQNAYWPLPGVVSFGTNKLSNFTFYHGIEEKTFFVQIVQTGWTEEQEDAPGRDFQDVRVVIIPGTVVGKLNAEILKSYEQTIAALGLTEEKNMKMTKAIKLKLPKRK